MDSWNCGLHTLGEMYLLTYKLAACVKMQSSIFVIIASSHSCKLFMETIQCKQVSAHILFSLTALVLDHSDIQLLRDLLLSLQTLKRYQNCSHFNSLKQLSHLLKFYVKVHWINTISPRLFHSHPWPQQCKLISDMKRDRSPELKFQCASLSLCRNMEECT